jgi:hypothetical protein
MSLLKNKIKKNYILFTCGETHIGCGLIVIIKGSLYCITAGHVIFGKEFDKEISPKLTTLQAHEIKEHELISDSEFAKKYDLAIFRIWDNIEDFHDITLCNTITNPKITSLTYIKATLLSDPYFLEPITYSDTLKENEYMYKAPSGSFNNFSEDEHGADAMEGISGSPIFLNTDDNELVFHGVISRIPNKGVSNLVTIRGIDRLALIVEKMQIKESTIYDSNFKLISYNKELLEKEKFLEWVEKWKAAPGNEGYYKNLKKKLKVIHGEYYKEYIPIELQKIMIGDACLKNDIESNSMLSEAYSEVISTAEREWMHEYVSTPSEALTYYKEVNKAHLEVIKSDLAEFDFKMTDQRKIAQYNVATWMAVCHLRFTKK